MTRSSELNLLRKDERGQAVVLLALTMAVLLSFAAVTVDVGYAYYTKRSLQADADASALAGAQALPDSATAASLARRYSGSAGQRNERVNVPNAETSVTISTNTVVVATHAHVNAIFSRILGFDGFNVGARAKACSLGTGSSFLIDEAAGSCPVIPGPCLLGYPFASGNPRTSVVFNESDVLRAFAPVVAGPRETIKVWYNDEHALTLGVRAVAIRTSSGTTTTNYAVAPLGSVPGSALNPAVGSTATSGDQAGTDTADRPMYPALFVTDVTDNPGSRDGDWQSYGTAIPPSAVFGTWKAAVKTVDRRRTPTRITITPDADPARNDWNLGPGSDQPPSGLRNEHYGAEARWNVDDLDLEPLHTYRMQFMVHDGDQNHTGGDSGEACMSVVMG